MSVWWLEWRRGLPWLLIPGYTLIDLLILGGGADRSWEGDWHATTLAASLPVVVLAPVAAAWTSFAVSRAGRTGFRRVESTMPRPGVGVLGLQWLVQVSHVIVAYLVGVVVASALTYRQSPLGNGPWPSFVVLTVAGLCLYTAIGAAAGRLIPKRWTSPIVGLAVFACIVAGSLNPGQLGRVTIFSWDLYAGPNQRLSLLYTGFALMTAASVSAFLMLIGGRAPYGPARLALWAVTGLTVTAGVGTLMAPGPLVPRPPIEAYCATGPTVVCVWPEHAKLAPDLAATAARLREAGLPESLLPARISEAGLAGPESDVFTVQPGPWSDIASANSITSAILPLEPPGCVQADTPRLERLILVRAWLQLTSAGRVGDDVQPNADLWQTLRSWPPDRQLGWFTRSVPLVATCHSPAPGPLA